MTTYIGLAELLLDEPTREHLHELITRYGHKLGYASDENALIVHIDSYKRAGRQHYTVRVRLLYPDNIVLTLYARAPSALEALLDATRELERVLERRLAHLEYDEHRNLLLE